MNVVILMGRMVRDPELKYTSGGKAFANFTLAVQKTKDEAEFIENSGNGGGYQQQQTFNNNNSNSKPVQNNSFENDNDDMDDDEEFPF